MATLASFFTRLETEDAVGLCLCWEINRTDGESFFFTNHDETVEASYDGEGKIFQPVTTFNPSAVKDTESQAVDNMSLVGLTSDVITEADLLSGLYEDAEFIVYAAQWDDLSVGLHILRRGWIGEVKAVGDQFEAEVRGIGYRLQQKVGRLYTLSCNAKLGDARCKVDLDNYYTVSATVDAVDSARRFTIGTSGEDAGYFQYGVVTFTSGENNGRKLEVMGHVIDSNGEHIVTFEKAPFPIEAGDTVLITAGCDKTLTTCKEKFSNVLNYRGFPFMPTEEDALETPNAR